MRVRLLLKSSTRLCAHFCRSRSACGAKKAFPLDCLRGSGPLLHALQWCFHWSRSLLTAAFYTAHLFQLRQSLRTFAFFFPLIFNAEADLSLFLPVLVLLNGEQTAFFNSFDYILFVIATKVFAPLNRVHASTDLLRKNVLSGSKTPYSNRQARLLHSSHSQSETNARCLLELTHAEIL